MSQIYQTQNLALAVTLATCGVPFAQGNDGQPCPFLHIYDAASLRKLGYSGLTLEEAARRAWTSGKKGLLVFSFEASDLLRKILKSYDAQSDDIKRADDSARSGQIAALEVEPETAARLLCQFAKNRNWLTSAWRESVPFLSLNGESKTETQGDKTTTVGSFKLVRLTASPETKQALGISH